MGKTRGWQQLIGLSLDGSPLRAAPPSRTSVSSLTKVIALWTPSEFLTSEGINVDALIAEVNGVIMKRGLITWDGQILKFPIASTADTDPIYEGSQPFDSPPKRQWGGEQAAYFGLSNPYQMAEQPNRYTQSHVMVRISDPYLETDERITAILHGQKDEHYFYCTCHSPDVVYTTHCRLICMGCGALHAVLRVPAAVCHQQSLSAQGWLDIFVEGGPRIEEIVELPILDFQDIEDAEMIWTTETWLDARHEFLFFARSSPEVIQEAIRGTERDPAIFLEAGWTAVELPPPPAHQVAGNFVDVDLIGNAAHSIQDGIEDYVASRTNSSKLVTAIPALFRAVELLLKARLEELSSKPVSGRINNPTVLTRLAKAGTKFVAGEIDTISELRRLRNNLQHGTARINHRHGLSLCRKTVVFIDRFVGDELSLWLGDVVDTADWRRLLCIPEIGKRAEDVVTHRLALFKNDPHAEIQMCNSCGRQALVRPNPKTGCSCLYCGYIPIAAMDHEEEEKENAFRAEDLRSS